MAKIDELKFEINGKEYKSNVNVRKSGAFVVKLDWTVAETLGLVSEYVGDTKEEVVDPITIAYHNYLNSKKQYKLFIGIVFKVNGSFMKDSEGFNLFNPIGANVNDREHYAKDAVWAVASQLHYGYKIYCKETHDSGNEVWYQVSEYDGRELHSWDKVIDGFLLGHPTHSTEGKLIPYSKQSLETLAKAKEGLRAISEILFNFISQDEENIVKTLAGGNLLLTQQKEEN